MTADIYNQNTQTKKKRIKQKDSNSVTELPTSNAMYLLVRIDLWRSNHFSQLIIKKSLTTLLQFLPNCLNCPYKNSTLLVVTRVIQNLD